MQRTDEIFFLSRHSSQTDSLAGL